ncbi:50S ribosomal protein L9 [Anaerocolumna aminovalerica]|jgi:large subunit ribosomal protein L9|uniref:Large ribosomal subunit protein bL9 n=1 Tax=Anaerocolumna aminovalerica TaxID=1527 RepID=A0A1I5I3B6_9FIRM|nr:50S ribosomal protein L9 [Anaerocolumna aminovalerica]MBU5332973.1 50S ribosomal protein L9 [Anaerocolumna aminovalerica]MDU6266119.1 50S ribosomal protein L9 [Anaerocolumna aminovalerica]SFO54680.1 LSU ribosomal protein L9P [Anaerocolumna aminovalerica]
MQIILTQDVKSLGKKGDLVNVSDGYARNFILPKKLGLEATPKNLNDLKLQKAAEEKRQKEILDEAKALAKEIESITMNMYIKAGEGGRTFGSISTKEIAGTLKEQHGFDIDKKKLQLPEPIKTIGTHTVAVKLHPQVTAELKVKVDEQ